MTVTEYVTDKRESGVQIKKDMQALIKTQSEAEERISALEAAMLTLMGGAE